MCAEVIKAIPPALDRIRMGRSVVADRPDPEQNLVFHNMNQGKIIIILNIAEPEAAAASRSGVS